MTRRGLLARPCVSTLLWCQSLNQNAMEGHATCVSLHLRSSLLVPPGEFLMQVRTVEYAGQSSRGWDGPISLRR